MKFIRKLFSTILVLSCFFVIGLSSQGVALAGTVQLPQTGQTICYDSAGTVKSCAGTGQDGALQMGVSWPNPRFAVSGDCVTDNLTGLMWTKNASLPNGKRTWHQALDYVASMNSGSGLFGYHDWRLPNVNELESLVHADQSNSATWLNTQGFTNVQSDYYWSSSSSASNTGNAWAVDMWDGYVSRRSSAVWVNYVWPVRSGQ